MNKYIIVFIILTVLGIMYEKYKLKFVPDEELEKYDLIKKYLLNDTSHIGGKPIMWVHTTHNINARHWQNFGSRNTTHLNQPYILSCIESIIKNCGNSFHVCLIDDSSFMKLLPNWDINIRDLADPIRSHMRQLGLAKLLQKYGGIQIPDSMIVLKDLKNLHDAALSTKCCFVGETLSRNIMSTHKSLTPNTCIIGCKKNSRIIKKYVKFLELLTSRDHTNEMDFNGDMERFLNKMVDDKEMIAISGKYFGSKDADGDDVTIDRLLGNTYINFHDSLCAIYLPEKEILSRHKYGWFARLSQEQLINCDAIACKYLVISQ